MMGPFTWSTKGCLPQEAQSTDEWEGQSDFLALSFLVSRERERPESRLSAYAALRSLTLRLALTAQRLRFHFLRFPRRLITLKITQDILFFLKVGVAERL